MCILRKIKSIKVNCGNSRQINFIVKRASVSSLTVLLTQLGSAAMLSPNANGQQCLLTGAWNQKELWRKWICFYIREHKMTLFSINLCEDESGQYEGMMTHLMVTCSFKTRLTVNPFMPYLSDLICTFRSHHVVKIFCFTNNINILQILKIYQ